MLAEFVHTYAANNCCLDISIVRTNPPRIFQEVLTVESVADHMDMVQNLAEENTLRYMEYRYQIVVAHKWNNDLLYSPT